MSQLLLLQDYLRRSTERHPERVALVMGERRVTYAELERDSARLANLLRAHGVSRGDRVCLLLPKSPEAIAAMLGTLRAGAAYVPVDVSSPAPRVQSILEACEPRLVLACRQTTPLADELARAGALNATIGLTDDSAGGESFAPAFRRAEWLSAGDELTSEHGAHDDLAHILFTSGSTGVPKGVTITHANVTHFVEWATAYFGTTETDRVSGHPPLHFDLSTFDIYGTLLAGAELHLVPPQESFQPDTLVRLIRDNELTQWFSVPSALTFMIKYGSIAHDDFPHLRRLIWCGEVIPTPTLIELMRRLPHVSFTNLYGPTEATIASSYHTMSAPPGDPTAAIPIGTACAGEELVVLDEQMRAVAAGETGEIYIGGVGLSPGYWRDAEKTAAAFRSRPGGDGFLAPGPSGDGFLAPGPGGDGVLATGSGSDADGGLDRLYRTGDLA
ncbi:MAG TPA: AMP-binding protein, partial [Solirubrobacteraceae bacterium]|nr:AMP-binding protein [Solirubrobacteraceae bacterium]